MEEFIDTFTSKVGDPEVAVLLPIHNEVDAIESFVLEFHNVVGSKIPLEIVLSEDGSTDGTKEAIKKISEKVPLKALLSPIRKGYARGIMDGLSYVESNYVLITDSDGQHDPRDFWKLWGLRKEYDIISGWRVKRADSLHRRVMSKTFQFIAKKLFDLPDLKDITAPFKLMKTEIAKEIANEYKYMKESFWTEFTIRAYKKGLKIKEVPVTHRPRTGGTTRVYKPWKIPKIAASQLYALLKLWRELK
ncbi:MAG TPA: glycosyltransferase family 2 protein [Candidatus Bathyarchaeota archaeon]|nr:glycosyltransferase family 2 protein [Candidatus Bathyarchaeota archaeon]